MRRPGRRSSRRQGTGSSFRGTRTEQQRRHGQQWPGGVLDRLRRERAAKPGQAAAERHRQGLRDQLRAWSGSAPPTGCSSRNSTGASVQASTRVSAAMASRPAPPPSCRSAAPPGPPIRRPHPDGRRHAGSCRSQPMRAMVESRWDHVAQKKNRPLSPAGANRQSPRTGQLAHDLQPADREADQGLQDDRPELMAADPRLANAIR